MRRPAAPHALAPALALAGALGAAAGPDPEWARADCSRRAVFSPPADAGACVLVRVPAEPGLDARSTFAAFAGDRPLAARPVGGGEGSSAWLVTLDPDARARPHCLYYEPGTPASDTAGGAGVRDPRPVLVERRPNPSRAVPNTWERLLFLYQSNAGTERTALYPDFGRLLPTAPSADDEGRPRASLVRLQTFLDCPRGGVHRFALDSVDTSFLLLDGDPVAAWPGTHRPGEWRTGPSLFVAAGPHRLEVFNTSRSVPWVQVGWMPPGAEEIVPIPANRYLCALEADDLRLERRDRTLHPAFTFTLEPAYGFRHQAEAFLPVRLVQRTANWVGRDLRYTWSWEGGEATGPEVLACLTRPARQTVRLEVRDDLGYVAQSERAVDARRVPVARHGLDARLDPLPAVAYAGDMVEPWLQVEGDAPADLEFELRWTCTWRDGRTDAFRRALRVTNPAVPVPLGRRPAGEWSGLAWEVRHRGRTVLSGEVAFLAPPFAALPARASGDALLDERGRRLVLVPIREWGRHRQPPLTLDQVFGRLACLDDTLALPDPSGDAPGRTFDRELARLLDGPDRPLVSVVRPAGPAGATDAYGPLHKFVRAPAEAARDADVVLLSLARTDYLARLTPAEFERHAAALTDLVTLGLRRPVLWITPPPDPGRAEAMRPYALAVRRVAEARDLPVADLYSAFSGRGRDGTAFFHGPAMALNPAGHALAAQVIARALLGAIGEGG